MVVSRLTSQGLSVFEPGIERDVEGPPRAPWIDAARYERGVW